MIENGVCTRCKGDAYLFYDAAGGHCWKCDVEVFTARLTGLETALRELHEVASDWDLSTHTRLEQITRIAAAALASDGQ